jgi:hypothetical protein
MLEISKIKIDGTQSRAAVNEQTVTDYCEALQNGATFPPVIIFKDGNDFWLADGFHRLLAHSRAGKTTIYEDIRLGTKRDAILFSVGANHEHGLRRTNADKRSAVMLLLSDGVWQSWSDTAIAKQCHVTQQFISKVRAELGEKPTEKIVTRGNTTYTQNTKNFGKKPPDTGRSVSDIFKSLDTPSVPQNTAHDDVPEEFRIIPMTHAEQLEQRVKELADCLEDTSKALADLGNDGADNYVSEITKLRRELDAVTVSRDSLMFENSELKKHIKYLEKKLKA